jgi:hypothetical protein
MSTTKGPTYGASESCRTNSSSGATVRGITKVDLRFPDFASDLAPDLIQLMVQHHPDKRMPLADVRLHPWILLAITAAKLLSGAWPGLTMFAKSVRPGFTCLLQ